MIGALEVPSEIGEPESDSDSEESDRRHKVVLKGATFKQSPPRDGSQPAQGCGDE